MKVRELMSHNVCTCSPETSLHEAAHIMWTCDVGCLVVTDDDRRPIGMITDRDITMAAYTQGVTLHDARVSSAMARTIVTCSVDASSHEVELLMNRAQVRRVPVVDALGRLMGIVALADLARAAQHPLHIAEMPGLTKTLAAITQRRLDGMTGI
ncbi:MAG TPA: CBS domain-containing protein [Polyangiaceae bacterium]|nr:CBS domain-containing protein [Polyangiaceae bacterium]